MFVFSHQKRHFLEDNLIKEMAFVRDITKD